jgi:NAD+ kinase
MSVAPPRKLLILYHPKAEGAQSAAEEIAGYGSRWSDVTAQVLPVDGGVARQQVAEQDMLIVLGGDGSMLRAGRLSAPHGVPVLGVNLGRLGFLAEVQPGEWRDILERVLAGDYWLEERMMLRVEHWRDGTLRSANDGLNEAVVGRGALAPPARLRTLIDGYELTTYVADGLIIATPTGSTAYALAAGGPILPPELKNILLVAIAPHLSMNRAIVLAQGATVDVMPYTDADHDALLNVDGQVREPLLDGDMVRVTMSENITRFVRVRPPTYFYASLMERMDHNPSAQKSK